MSREYDLQEGISFTAMSFNEQQITLYIEEMNKMEKERGTGCTYHVKVREITTDLGVLRRYRVYMNCRNPAGEYIATPHLTDFATGERIRLICYALHTSTWYHKYHT